MEKVIFDTNAYRYLVTDKDIDKVEKTVKRLRKKEEKKGLQSLISPIVARELLAHIADRDDPAYEKCLKAIRAMYLHSGDEYSYHLLASPDMLIAKVFFNETLAAKEETNKALVQMAFNLGLKPTKHAFRKLQHNLNLNRAQVLGAESDFALSFLDFVRNVDPAAKSWQPFANDPAQRTALLANIRSVENSINLAAGLIVTVYYLLLSSGKKIELDYERLYDMSAEFIKIFPEYIALYKKVFENIVNSEFNMLEDNRSNFLWDLQLMLNVGNHSIDGGKLYFVTSDKAMIGAAVNANAKYTILTYAEYREYVD
jgi:hypothetical protein